MIELKINKEVIQRFKQEGFYPDDMMTSYLALMELHVGRAEILDLLDDYNSSRRMIMVFYNLLDKGMWRESATTNLNFVETEKGARFCEELIALTTDKPQNDNVESWITDWIELFPKGVKSGGKLLRSDKVGCLKKMRQFVKDYKYSKDLIFEATNNYLNEREKDGFKYCKSATYLIDKKGEGSELAALIEDLKDSGEESAHPLYSTNSGLI